MNDETRQFRIEIFIYVLLSLLLVALVMAGVGLFTGGLASPWFIRAIALLIITLVAFVLHKFGRLVIASYVVVLQLLGFVAEILLQPDAVSSAVPYLLIPIVIISSFLLSPLSTFIIAVCAAAGILILVAVTNRWSMANLLYLLPPLGLTLVMAFLSAESRRYADKLSELVEEGRGLLKERTLELMGAKEKAEWLQQQVSTLQKQAQTKAEISRTEQLPVSQRDKRLFDLIKGTAGELRLSIEKFERVIEKFSEQISNANLLGPAWQALDHFKGLAVNLDELTEIEDVQLKLNYGAVDITRLMAETVGTAQALARGKDVQIRYQTPETLPLIQADETRLRQVLLHLLQNAIKFTDQGIIEVQAELNEKEVMIFVSDTGIGMHREEADLVFETFGRGSGALAKERQGSGLGLAICKRLIELQGGRMWVTSVLGIGSTFYLALPLQPGREKTRETATLINRELLPVSANVPQEVTSPPQPAPQTKDEPIVALPASARTPQPVTSPSPSPSPDKDETMLSLPQDRTTRILQDLEDTVVPEQPSPKPARKPIPPIQRYGPTYIRRFGLILLTLLLVVLGIVGTLALVNLTIEPEAIAGATNTTLANTGLPEASAPTPTEILPSPALAESLQPTPTNSPTAPPASPTLEQAAADTVVPENTATPLPPTAIPTDTPVIPPPTIVPTNTAAPSEPPAPTNTPAAEPQTGPGLSNFPRLTFAASENGGLSVAGIDFGNNAGIRPVENNRLSWSPAGRAIFAGEQNGERDIFVTDNTSEQPVQLTTSAGDDLYPAWSPDGSKIAFSSGRTGNFDIYVMDADGSNIVQLTGSQGFDEWPVWSPDGSKIAFVTDRDGNTEIYVMDADGGNQQRLTNSPAADWPAAWSPDGQWLVFSSERDGDWNLYLVAVSGGPALRITDAPGNERDPIWSPDGQTIAFAYDGPGNYDIYSLSFPTDAIATIPPAEWTQITNTPGDERYPVWSQ